MNKVYYLLVCLLLCTSAVFGQQDTTKIARSESKVVIAGQVYYVHIVKEGQSLPAISEAYGVTQKEIARENPEIVLGLQVGQALKIPYNPQIKQYKPETSSKKEEPYRLYLVKPKETVFSLHRKFRVSEDTIYALNPKVEEEGLKAGQYIKIPRKGWVASQLEQMNETGETHKPDSLLDDKKFVYHKVQPQETIFRLKQTYNVSEEELYTHNPILKEGLKFGQLLKIPRHRDTTLSVLFTGQDTSQGVPIDELIHRKPFKEYFSEFCPADARLQGNFKVALLMPFFLDENSQEFYIDSSQVGDDGKKIYEKKFFPPDYIYPPSKGFVEFYQGFLLAVDSLKKRGLSVDLQVFDTARDTMKIKQLLYNESLANTDLIIGPAYKEGLRPVLEFARKRQIPVVSPFSRDMQALNNNPYFYQVFPSYASRMETFAERIAHDHQKNLVLIHSGDTLENDNLHLMKEKLFLEMSKYTFISSVQFKEVAFQDSVSSIEQALLPDQENIIIVPSNNEAFVTDLVTNLNTLQKDGYRMKLYGLSRWQRFENVDPNYYFNLHLSIIQIFYPDYSEPITEHFMDNYHNAFRGEASQFAFHGFDVGIYFLSALGNYGKQFSRCLHQHNPRLLQGNFSFVKWNPGSGLENTEVFWLDYQEGLQIEQIKEYRPVVMPAYNEW